ncbi:GDSL family lipase [Fibrella aestuarina BUZ 2]|uniref:GDSL family lipase n=1 Tax=Fibrella aestuarina BUZ 2 TaxID=1166018 RepID=I0K414_9BACT|nr:GDSL-type esterase/lipase family protein [Fibrella aestuarina]CCG98867.1 GDSL family lipase [Fibrella aestuarina BUZ 2]
MLLFSEEINALEKKVKATPPGRTVFYGSSSIRLWANLERDFPQIDALNLGFGGSTLAACAWHFERLVVPAQPRALILYAGDNDLGEGRQPEEVCLFFRDLARQIEQHLPNVPVSFLSIKPSPARWQLVDSIRLANRFIADDISRRPQFQFIDATVAMLTPDGRPDHSLYEADGLHLSPAGYARWREQLIGYVK